MKEVSELQTKQIKSKGKKRHRKSLSPQYKTGSRGSGMARSEVKLAKKKKFAKSRLGKQKGQGGKSSVQGYKKFMPKYKVTEGERALMNLEDFGKKRRVKLKGVTPSNKYNRSVEVVARNRRRVKP